MDHDSGSGRRRWGDHLAVVTDLAEAAVEQRPDQRAAPLPLRLDHDERWELHGRGVARLGIGETQRPLAGAPLAEANAREIALNLEEAPGSLIVWQQLRACSVSTGLARVRSLARRRGQSSARPVFGSQPPTGGLSASWWCQVRAHRVEQNGSAFLTAISERVPRQFAQRPSRRSRGSTRSGGRPPILRRVSSAKSP